MTNEVNLTSVIKKFKTNWEDILSKLSDEINIDVSIIDDSRFNASVRLIDHSENRYLITVNEGVFYKTWNFYHSTFNKSNPSLINMSGFLNEGTPYNEKFAVGLSNLYITITINFVFFHELGHILNNHLLYLNSLGYTDDLLMQYPDANIIDGLSISSYEYQMLEIDADEFATRKIYNEAINEYVKNKILGISSVYTIAQTEKHLSLYILSALIYERSLHGLGFTKKEKYNFQNAKYIPNRMRLLVISKELISEINKCLENDVYPEELLMDHIENFESTMNKFLIEKKLYEKSKLSTKNNLDELNEEVFNHIVHLKENIFPNLKNKLDFFQNNCNYPSF